MIWEDMLLDNIFADAEISNAISLLFNVDSDQIMVVKELLRGIGPEDIRIICEVYIYTGDFPMRLNIILRDQELEPMDRISFVNRLCDLLHCAALVDDSSDDPYSMLLVRSGTSPKKVLLNADRYDEEEFVISWIEQDQ